MMGCPCATRAIESNWEIIRVPLSTLRPGVHVVMATPFLPNEELDEASVRTLVDVCAEAGSDGLLVLGVMGEADRLSDAERERVIDLTIDHNAGRMQVTVGVTAGSTAVARARAVAAARRGVDAVMVAPPPGSSAGAALREHFRCIGDGLEVPVVVQDHPPSSGVKLPAEFIARLFADLPPGSALKLEDPPTASKLRDVRSCAAGLPVFGGSGGLFLLEELEAGAAGVMTGVAAPETLVRIVREHRAGNSVTARTLFAAALPLMLFESQPGLSTGLRKEILRRRGAIQHATVRQPAPTLSAETLRELEALVAETAKRDGETARRPDGKS
jgi:4-hydroxy-tetrahydrodipicolinate synthase